MVFSLWVWNFSDFTPSEKSPCLEHLRSWDLWQEEVLQLEQQSVADADSAQRLGTMRRMRKWTFTVQVKSCLMWFFVCQVQLHRHVFCKMNIWIEHMIFCIILCWKWHSLWYYMLTRPLCRYAYIYIRTFDGDKEKSMMNVFKELKIYWYVQPFNPHWCKPAIGEVTAYHCCLADAKREAETQIRRGAAFGIWSYGLGHRPGIAARNLSHPTHVFVFRIDVMSIYSSCSSCSW